MQPRRWISAGAGGGPAGPGAAHGQERQVLGKQPGRDDAQQCPSKTRWTLCRSAQIVRVRPAMPCRTVTACRPDTMVTLPLAGTRVSNSTAVLRGTGADGGSITSLSSHGTAIWSSFAVGMVI